MPSRRKRIRPKKHPLCTEQTAAGKPCRWQALPGATTCHNHAPERAEVRKAAGAIRHPMRFHPEHEERLGAVQPTFERLADRLIDIADQAQRGTLLPERARVATTAIRGAVMALQARRLRPVEVTAHDAAQEPAPAPPEESLVDALRQ